MFTHLKFYHCCRFASLPPLQTITTNVSYFTHFCLLNFLIYLTLFINLLSYMISNVENDLIPDGILTATIALGQSEPRSNGNERVLHIPQTCNLTIRWFSVIPRRLVGVGSYLSAKMQLAYSSALANWAIGVRISRHNIHILMVSLAYQRLLWVIYCESHCCRMTEEILSHR